MGVREVVAEPGGGLVVNGGLMLTMMMMVGFFGLGLTMMVVWGFLFDLYSIEAGVQNLFFDFFDL